MTAKTAKPVPADWPLESSHISATLTLTLPEIEYLLACLEVRAMLAAKYNVPLTSTQQDSHHFASLKLNSGIVEAKAHADAFPKYKNADPYDDEKLPAGETNFKPSRRGPRGACK